MKRVKCKVESCFKIGLAKDSEDKRHKAINCNFEVYLAGATGFMNVDIYYDLFEIVKVKGSSYQFINSEVQPCIEALWLKGNLLGVIDTRMRGFFLKKLSEEIGLVCKEAQRKLYEGKKNFKKEISFSII